MYHMGLHAGETAWPNAGLGSSIGRVRSTPVIWPLDTWGLIGWQSCSHSTSACNSSDTACHCTNHTTTVRSTVQYSTVKYSTVQKKSKLSNFSNFEFYFKFWEKLDEYNQKTMFFSIFPTLRLFFQLCSNFYVLRIWKITISKPLMMESWNFHRLFSMIIYIDDLHFRNHSWKNDCTELEKV